jgi:hypothetical protein
MPVAGDHHRIVDLARVQVLDDPVARGREAVPRVVPEQVAGVAVMVELGHQDLLRDHVPAGVRAVEPAQQPALLVRAGHREPRVERRGAALLLAVAARRLVAVLARVEEAQLGKVAPRDPAVDRHVLAVRDRLAAQGQMLVVQIRVGLVQRMPQPVLLERLRVVRELRRQLRLARPEAVGDP